VISPTHSRPTSAKAIESNVEGSQAFFEPQGATNWWETKKLAKSSESKKSSSGDLAQVDGGQEALCQPK